MTQYSEAYRIVQEYWENPATKKNWRNPINLIKEMNWNIIGYDDNSFFSPEGEAYSTYKSGENFIMCRMNIPQTRISYNIHHEVGHIVGGHPLRFDDIIYKSCKNKAKKKIETEATIIGRNIFLPAPILKKLIYTIGKNNLIKYLQYAYNLSKEYIKARIGNLKTDLNNIKFPENFFEDDFQIELDNAMHYLYYNDCYCYGINLKEIEMC